MINFNDLIGLRYKWQASPSDNSGYTDCFQLSMEVRKRLGCKSYVDDYAWVYSRYQEENLPARQFLRWILTHFSRVKVPVEGCLFYLPADNGRIAMGAVSSDMDGFFIGPGNTVVRMDLARLPQAKFFGEK